MRAFWTVFYSSFLFAILATTLTSVFIAVKRPVLRHNIRSVPIGFFNNRSSVSSTSIDKSVPFDTSTFFSMERTQLLVGFAVISCSLSGWSFLPVPLSDCFERCTRHAKKVLCVVLHWYSSHKVGVDCWTSQNGEVFHIFDYLSLLEQQDCWNVWRLDIQHSEYFY